MQGVDDDGGDREYSSNGLTCPKLSQSTISKLLLFPWCLHFRVISQFPSWPPPPRIIDPIPMIRSLGLSYYGHMISTGLGQSNRIAETACNRRSTGQVKSSGRVVVFFVALIGSARSARKERHRDMGQFVNIYHKISMNGPVRWRPRMVGRKWKWNGRMNVTAAAAHVPLQNGTKRCDDGTKALHRWWWWWWWWGRQSYSNSHPISKQDKSYGTNNGGGRRGGCVVGGGISTHGSL